MAWAWTKVDFSNIADLGTTETTCLSATIDLNTMENVRGGIKVDWTTSTDDVTVNVYDRADTGEWFKTYSFVLNSTDHDNVWEDLPFIFGQRALDIKAVAAGSSGTIAVTGSIWRDGGP